MRYINNTIIVKILKILENITIDNNNIIINHNSNFSIDDLDNKSPKKI